MDLLTFLAFLFVILLPIAFLSEKGKPRNNRSKTTILPKVPEIFIVLDVETTGLDPERDEIIEVGAIKCSLRSKHHPTYESMIKTHKKLPKRITEITGITQSMVDAGGNVSDVLMDLHKFIADYPIVAFNAEFDKAFIKRAYQKYAPGLLPTNSWSCALKASRQAWPGRESYKLGSLCLDHGISASQTHRALGDAELALQVYIFAKTVIANR